jgi:hypothetical protein
MIGLRVDRAPASAALRRLAPLRARPALGVSAGEQQSHYCDTEQNKTNRAHGSSPSSSFLVAAPAPRAATQAAAPPSSVMKSRRFIQSPRQRVAAKAKARELRSQETVERQTKKLVDPKSTNR